MEIDNTHLGIFFYKYKINYTITILTFYTIVLNLAINNFSNDPACIPENISH